MKQLLSIMLLLSLTNAYCQCAGIGKVVNPKKQRTTFYSPHYDSPTDAPLRFVRYDNQDGSTDLYLSITVLGDSAHFDPADVDSMALQAQTTFTRLAERDSLKRASPQKPLPPPTNRIDSMAAMMDSTLIKLGMRSSLRDSLMQAALTHKNEPTPMAYRGSSLTFSDGTKLSWPDRLVSFKSVGGVGSWSNFVRLTEGQVTQLSRGLISEVSVYKHERNLTKEQAEEARQILHCMQAAK